MNSDATEAALGLLRLSPHNVPTTTTTTTTTTQLIPLKRKHTPAQPPKDNGSEETFNPDAINCICSIPYDDGFSIACDDCSRWCHAACFDIIEGEVPEEWRCWVCVPRRVDRERAVRIQRARMREGEEALRRQREGGRLSPGAERKGRRAGAAAIEGGKRRRRTSINFQQHSHPPTTPTTTSAPTAAPGPPVAGGGGGAEDEQVNIDEPWTHSYIPITQDIIPHKDTRDKLRKQAQHWRGITALTPAHQFPAQPQQQQQQQKQKPKTTIHPLPPAPHTPQILPPSYALHTTTPVPSSDLITPYISTIIPSASYLSDPLNAYAHLGMPKPFVHLLGSPLDLALDARVTGGEGRWVRSGCRPNAVLRPVVCGGQAGAGEEGGEGGAGKGETLSFGVFALRDLSPGEEVVLGWEWDDGSAVHSLPALIENPHTFPRLHRAYIKRQLAGLLHALGSTFTTCACGARARDCAVRRMAEFVDAEEEEEEGEEGQGEKVDLGPLIGTERGFRTRERVPWSGGMSGVEMDVDVDGEGDVEFVDVEGGGDDDGDEMDRLEEEGDADADTDGPIAGPSTLRERGERRRRVDVADVAIAFRASQHPHIPTSPIRPHKPALSLPTLTLSPATSSPSPRKRVRISASGGGGASAKGKGRAAEIDDGEGEEEGSSSAESGRSNGPNNSHRSRARRHVTFDPSPSSSPSLSHSHVYSPYPPSRSDHDHDPHTAYPPRSPRPPRPQIVTEDQSLESSGDGEEYGSDTTEKEGRVGGEEEEEEEEEEDKMPPKMRKRWIHRSVELLKDMLERSGSGSGEDGSPDGDEAGENEQMDVDDTSPTPTHIQPTVNTDTLPHPMPPPPMPASLDPTTIMSVQPTRTTSPPDPRPSPSPSTSFAKLSLLSPIVPPSAPGTISNSGSAYSLSLFPNNFPFPVPRHNTTSPSPLSQSHSRLYTQNGHPLSLSHLGVQDQGGTEDPGGPRSSLSSPLTGELPGSPLSLTSATAFGRKRSPEQQHDTSLEKRSPSIYGGDSPPDSSAGTTDPRPLPHRSPTPEIAPSSSLPLTPKVKMSLKDFALRKKKQREEEEIAKATTSPVSPGSTTCPLEPSVGAKESASPTINGVKLESAGNESREDTGVEGEVGPMAVDKPAEEHAAPPVLNGVVDGRGDSKEATIRADGSPKPMRSPSRSQSPQEDRTRSPNSADSLDAKVEPVDGPKPSIVLEKKPLDVKDSQLEPPHPPLNGASEKRGPDPNGDIDHIPAPSLHRPSHEDGEIRGISPPKQPSFVPRAHTPPTQPRSFNVASPGSVSTASPSTQPRRTSQSMLARPSTGPLSRPLPSGPRALRAVNLLGSPSAFPPGRSPAGGPQFIPRGPSADRERMDWDRDRSWPGPARARGRGAGSGWGR